MRAAPTQTPLERQSGGGKVEKVYWAGFTGPNWEWCGCDNVSVFSCPFLCVSVRRDVGICVLSVFVDENRLEIERERMSFV